MSIFGSFCRFIDTYSPISIQPHDRILSAISNDGIVWRREKGIRCNIGGKQKSNMVYYCSVLCFPEGIWRMYYLGSRYYSKYWRSNIYSATSKDGINWHPETGARIEHGGLYDTFHCHSPYIIRFNEKHFLYYIGINQNGRKSLLVAISDDGVNWHKRPEPLLSSGSLKEISCDNIHDISIVVFNKTMRAYFSATSLNTSAQIFSALSQDGISWKIEDGIRIKADPEITGCFVNNPSIIITDDGEWRLYFRSGKVPVLNNSIYMARSNDGTSWFDYKCVLTYDEKGRYDTHAVGFPHVVKLQDKKWRMYYTGYFGRHIFESRTLNAWKKSFQLT